MILRSERAGACVWETRGVSRRGKCAREACSGEEVRRWTEWASVLASEAWNQGTQEVPVAISAFGSCQENDLITEPNRVDLEL